MPETAAGRTPETPPEVRKVLVAPEVFTGVLARTSEGYGLTCEWGTADYDGFYAPTFTIHYEDDLRAEARALGRAEAREAVRLALEGDVAHLLDDTDILEAIDNLETP